MRGMVPANNAQPVQRPEASGGALVLNPDFKRKVLSEVVCGY
jgi:hypothetical protein